jgi:predicted helicase
VLPQFEFAIPALAHEAQAVNAVKRYQRFTVVIGNPPYAAASSNRGTWISDLIDIYKEEVRDQETQIRMLSDDYVKFVRLGGSLIEAAGLGVLGMITNSGYTDGVIFRGMRRSLVETFDLIAILDLHGHGRRGASTNSERDENVFDILVGTCIGLFTAPPHGSEPRRFSHADLFGLRSAKYAFLATTTLIDTPWTSVDPGPPLWLFRSFDAERSREYGEWVPFLALWGSEDERRDRHVLYGFGIKTQQDEFAIAFDRPTLIGRIEKLLAPKTTEAELRNEFRLCKTNQWSFIRARRRLASDDWHRKITPVLYIGRSMCE